MKSALDMNEVATLSTVLLTHLDENLFFAKISDFMMEHFEEYKVQVFEAYSDGVTELRAVNGKPVEDSIVYPKGQGLSGYVTRMKRAYYSNSKRDPLLSTSKRDDCVETEVCVPIISDGTVLGTIHIQSDNADRKFAEEDVTIINNILNSLEAPIANMRMYLIAKNLNRDLQNRIIEKEQELSQRGPAIQNKSSSNGKIEIIGHSNSFVEIINMAKRVACEDFPVLLVGPSGTGKKLLAKKIHSLSERKNGECIVVHCSAIEETALELELFGTKERPGLLEAANGGTIVLDSVDELPVGVQAKLLRAIISGEIYNIDSNTPKSINVRIISTAREALDTKVEEGTFREDLLYRLNIVSLAMPSLAQRQDDIKVLAEHFLNLGKSKEDSKVLTSGAIEKLINYNWPGNVQELRNIMERTFILSEERYIDEGHLPNFVQEVKEEVQEVESFTEMTLHELEKLHICRTLDHLGGNKTRAAKVLGITVKTLYNKLHSYGLVNTKSE
jgi:Nif-specific regulatory protein